MSVIVGYQMFFGIPDKKLAYYFSLLVASVSSTVVQGLLRLFIITILAVIRKIFRSVYLVSTIERSKGLMHRY